MSVELYRQRPFMWYFGKPIDPCQQKIQRKWKRAYEMPIPTQSTLIGRKNRAKFENDCVSRNGDRIKITEPNSMTLVSFSSAEDASFNDVKRCDTFRSQGTENPPFRFFFFFGGHLVSKNGTALREGVDCGIPL